MSARYAPIRLSRRMRSFSLALARVVEEHHGQGPPQDHEALGLGRVQVAVGPDIASPGSGR
jgi:hypothetical protein